MFQALYVETYKNNSAAIVNQAFIGALELKTPQCVLFFSYYKISNNNGHCNKHQIVEKSIKIHKKKMIE